MHRSIVFTEKFFRLEMARGTTSLSKDYIRDASLYSDNIVINCVHRVHKYCRLRLPNVHYKPASFLPPVKCLNESKTPPFFLQSGSSEDYATTSVHYVIEKLL